MDEGRRIPTATFEPYEPVEARQSRFAHRVEALERVASRPLGAVLLFVLALAAYALVAIAWPLAGGRDLDEYLLAYTQLFDHHVLLPWSLLFRTPLTPLVAGVSLDPLGGALAEPISAVLFAISVVAWAIAARAFGARVALTTAAALLLYPGYAAMFHELSSESVTACSFAIWAALFARATTRPSAARWALAGLGIALLALARPGNAVLVAFCLFPLLLGGRWRPRFGWVAAATVAAVVPLGAWTAHNGLRFHDYALARGGNAIVPFYRAFITDHIISPENGSASRRLATAMQAHLLTRQPYRGYRVTLDELFRKGSFRVHEDLFVLSDQVFGWDSNYSVLREAGIEGVRARPSTYARSVGRTLWNELAAKAYFRLSPGSGPVAPEASQPRSNGASGALPTPTEGQPIPAGQVVWISRPDQSIRQVWTSPTKWHFEFGKPGERRRFDAIQHEVSGLFANLPDRNGNATFAHRLDQASRWYPRPLLWIVVGLIGIALRRPRHTRLLLALALAAFTVVLLNALGLFTDLHFVLPVAPAFLLLGTGGLLGVRTGISPRAS
jgi:hypothetical protein